MMGTRGKIVHSQKRRGIYMPLTLKGYARRGGKVRPMLSSEIKSKAIQLLTSHSKEINCR